MARTLSLFSVGIAALVLVLALIARSRIKQERERQMYGALAIMPGAGIIGQLPLLFKSENTALQVAASITSMVLTIAAFLQMRRATKRTA